MRFKQQSFFKKKLSLETIYPLSLIIICMAFAYSIIPTGFYTDDFVFLARVQQRVPFFENVFNTIPLASSYYRPILTLIWGICYKLFGLWAPGYNIVEFCLYLGIILFFYKSVSLLTNCPLAFISSLFLLLHTAAHLLSWLAWITTISALFFLWFTIYFIIRNGILSRNSNLFFIIIGTVLAILSKETTYVPLLIILFYYAVFDSPGKKVHSYVYGLLISFILLMMKFGPSGVFRARSGHYIANISTNLHHHLQDIVYHGFPILVIPLLFSIIIYARERNIFKSFAFYLPTSVVLIMHSQIPEVLGGKYINDYLFGLLICIIILIWRKYIYEFIIELVRKKGLIWYFLFSCTFIPILTFYLSSNPYHYISFSLLLTAFAVTYFIWADKFHAALSHEYENNKLKTPHLFSLKSFLVIVIISSLALNSVKVIYHNLNIRKAVSNTSIREYRAARSSMLEKLADQIINNSQSHSMVISAKDSAYVLSDNSRFLFIHIRHKSNNFRLIFNPDAPVKNYNNNFIVKLKSLDLDPEISFDTETEKYIMEQVREI